MTLAGNSVDPPTGRGVATARRARSEHDDAAVHDRKAGVYAEPSRVHPVVHDGPLYRVRDIALSEPSIQRTPMALDESALHELLDALSDSPRSGAAVASGAGSGASLLRGTLPRVKPTRGVFDTSADPRQRRARQQRR